MQRRRIAGIGASAFAAGALVLVGVASPSSASENGSAAASAENEPIAHGAASTTAERDAVEFYWTAERMREAVPMDQQVRPSALSGSKAVERGEPTVVQPQQATADAEPMEFPQAGGPWTDGGEVTQTAGRVFFTFDGQESSCSGNAVVSDNSSTVITAGHCVKYQGSWHEDWVFVPGYDNGEAPHGTWTAEQTLTTPQWESSEDMNYDVGAAVVAPLDGQNLTDVVGGQGLSFNADYNIDQYAFGYPAEDPYDGEQLIYCSGTTTTDPLLTDDHGMACDMTGGSSGGPWFAEFDESTGVGLQSSVNSFGYVFLPDTMFGPYFGAEAEELYNTAQGS